MRKFAFLVAAIGIAAGSMQQAPVSAQDGASGGSPPIKYRMFLEDGTPTRSTTNLKLQEAEKLKAKKEAEQKKVERSKIQGGLVVDPKIAPGADLQPAPIEDESKVVLRGFDKLNRLTRGRDSKTYEKGSDKNAKQSNDDAALNAAACKTALAAGKPLPQFCRPQPSLIDRSFIDRMEADRVEQLRAGPGGFNPNKP